MAHTEQTVQIILMNWALKEKRHVLALPNNRSLYRWEADLLTLTSSGLFHEFEVKLNLSDYERDFSGSSRKVAKHNIMKKNHTTTGANYFWFVTSGFQPSWIPFYAGWIEIVNNEVIIKKNADRLHTVPANINQLKKCLRSISFRLLNKMES